jgi:L-aminopeptidase/D-esterase-like protein
MLYNISREIVGNSEEENTMQEISITDIENILIGNAQDTVNATGCTVIICERTAPTGLAVMGGGPASRESELLKPVANADGIHAVLLSGGSAYGLDAAGGVMQYLEERGIGLNVGAGVVPLVCQSCIFDLGVGSFQVRPDKAMGYAAAENAYQHLFEQGNYGAGTGASVGKLCGMERAVKTGLGAYAVQIGDLKVGAVVVVNALGDIFDYDNGQMIAGLLGKDGKTFANSEEELYRLYKPDTNLFVGNTTIGSIITNGKFNKTQMNKIAAMSHNGYARTIRPVNTSADGDSIYAMSVGEVMANVDMVGTLGAMVMGRAIRNAVTNAVSAYGLQSGMSIVE